MELADTDPQRFNRVADLHRSFLATGCVLGTLCRIVERH
jgi:hypothetical protein